MDSFEQAVAASDAIEPYADGRESSRDRRERERASWDRGDIAPEIAFLGAYGVGPGTLLQAMRAAEGCGASADEALLAEGLMGHDAYYRALARHLRVPFFAGELAMDRAVDPAHAIASGIAPLRPNDLGLRAVVAPRGRAARFLIDAVAGGASLGGLVVTSPHRLSACVRAATRARIADAAINDLERRDPALSARSGLWGRQIGAFAPDAPLLLASSALWALFAIWVVTRNLAVAAAAGNCVAEPLSDEALPVYSIVAPLYREANMAARLTAAFDAIDYPRAKLEIKIVVEQRDEATIAALEALDLPARYEIVVAPSGGPSTKPRALNVALPLLRGELVVIYDAEDTPDPDQLRLAAARFHSDPAVDCLQARVTVENAERSWIARMFAIEYATLFDLVNPGLAALELPIALGGTSNHFRASTLRRVGGWDAWNVTEDADLGVRLARAGGRVGALGSDTREEAPIDLPAWFRQRVRWQKGWMQTLIVHSRHPIRLFRELGATGSVALIAMIAGSVLGGLFGPFLAVAALSRAGLEGLEGAGAWRVAQDIATCTLMALGLLTMVTPALASARRRGIAGAPSLAGLPIYWLLIAAATWAAVFDLAVRPFYWAKTEHGRASAPRDAPPRPRQSR